MGVRVGLVGCGRVAQTHHGPVLASLEGATLAALIDPSPEARAAIQRKAQGALAFSDLSRAIDVAQLDALVICTPPATHAAIARQALEAGLHVYIEKPLARDLSEAAEIAQAAERSGKVAMVGHNFRMHPAVRAARDLIAAGEIGEVVGVQGLFCSERRTLPGWKSEPGQGGDAIFDLGSHHLDLVPTLTGLEVLADSLKGQEWRESGGSMASLVATLEGGQPVSLSFGQRSGRSANWMEIFGETAHIRVDLVSQRPPKLLRPGNKLSPQTRIAEKLTTAWEAIDIRHRPEPSFRSSLAHFVEHAASGDPKGTMLPLIAGEQALRLALAARRSIEGEIT